MLLFSYILAASLEMVMSIRSFQAGYLSYAWSFGFLLLLSAGSIPMETSSMGKMVRDEFKSIGIDTAKLDFISNAGRISAYILIIINIFNFVEGLIMAYAITFLLIVFGIVKYLFSEKKF